MDVYLEVGKKRVFACSLAWPGWCRSGRTEELALSALADYAPRYGIVAARAGLVLPAADTDGFRVVERLPGNATTDFGAPDRVAADDTGPTDAAAARRMAALVVAAWEVFDEVGAGSPAELRKGPRGGGRDRDKMIDHVISSDAAYARMIGIKVRPPGFGDTAAVTAMREAVIAVLGTPSDGTSPRPNGWPTRYAARRIAWHALDHAWEMLDRADPAG